MLLQQEYDEIIDALGGPGAGFYKFFSAFSAKGTVIKFGSRVSAIVLDETVVSEFRSYIKTQKEWVRESRRPLKEMEQRMWWMVCKLFEHDIFSVSDHQYIMKWYSLCSDQLTSP
jgi:hypothetical protein